MEYIFRPLDLNDLINVADANMQFRAAADTASAHKYKCFEIVLCTKEAKPAYYDLITKVDIRKCLTLWC